ncbi:hypothetical protein, partial [Pseudomonas sp. NPDC089734]|uniref:hypothetical protein n=1 Tax=Pseudomonas sp. NPDC089734 TaxID=3364469 RepID=UPI00381D9C96
DKKENGLLMPDSADKAKSMKRVFYHCGSHANYSRRVEGKIADIKDVYEATSADNPLAGAQARTAIAALQSEMRLELSVLGPVQMRLN